MKYTARALRVSIARLRLDGWQVAFIWRRLLGCAHIRSRQPTATQGPISLFSVSSFHIIINRSWNSLVQTSGATQTHSLAGDDLGGAVPVGLLCQSWKKYPKSPARRPRGRER